MDCPAYCFFVLVGTGCVDQAVTSGDSIPYHLLTSILRNLKYAETLHRHFDAVAECDIFHTIKTSLISKMACSLSACPFCRYFNRFPRLYACWGYLECCVIEGVPQP